MDKTNCKMAMKAISENEVDKRVTQVTELIANGYTRKQIVELITNDYKVCIKTADNYIKKAKTLIFEESKGERAEIKALALYRYNQLYKKNNKIQDYRECRAVQESINKIFGLEKQVHEHTTGIKVIIEGE